MDDIQRGLLAQISSMYYEQGMTQNEIASQLGLSRVKIYRLLKQAKEEQVVQITINWPIKRHAQLEQALKQTFGLKEALVLATASQDPVSALQRLGQLGARYLEQVLKDGTTMAVCLGRTTYEVVNAIRPGFQAKVRVAQAIGSMPFAMRELDSAALARQLAQKWAARCCTCRHPSWPIAPKPPRCYAASRASSAHWRLPGGRRCPGGHWQPRPNRFRLRQGRVYQPGRAGGSDSRRRCGRCGRANLHQGRPTASVPIQSAPHRYHLRRTV